MILCTMKVNNGFSAANAGWAGAENRESGVNPERYRHCKRGGTPQGESRSLEGFSEKTVWVLWMREPGYLLRPCDRQTPASTGDLAAFGAGIRLRQPVWAAAVFAFGAAMVPPPLSRLPTGAQTLCCVFPSPGRGILSPEFQIRCFLESAASAPSGCCGFCNDGDEMEKRLPRILIAGTNSGCGKTTLVCGILQALKNRGKRVCSFKCGPDYIDPMFHSAVMDTQCRNLDLQFFDENTLRFLLARGGEGFDLAVVEGVMGYYDGVGLTCEASSYHVGRVSRTPAVLVVNAKGAAHSLLATLSGFVGLYPDSGIRGVIFNNCSPMLYPRLKEAAEARLPIRCLGFLPPIPEGTLESRHLGLITAAEIGDLQQRLQKIAEQAEKTVDLDGLIALAESAEPLCCAPPELPEPGTPVRIGVARDKAFCFYYQDSLELLEQLGARLVRFSPLEDPALPEDLDGLYLGGGYPELYTKALSENTSMRESIRTALESGLPCIAECGGFLYLQEKLCGMPMVGFLPGSGDNTGKLVRFGYVTLTAKKDNLLCAAGERIPAHEFHYFDVDDPGDGFVAAKATGRSWECGVAGEKLYAGFPHFHFYAQPQMAARFLAVCRKEKKSHA